MKKPRLLLVSTVQNTFETVLKGQPRWLSDTFDVRIATSVIRDPGTIEAAEETTPINVPMTRGISPVKDLISIWRMVRVMRQFRPDIVQSYTPKGGLVGMIAGMIAGVPVRVHTFTGLLFPTATGRRRQMLMWADRVIAGAATHVVPEGQGVLADLDVAHITRKPLCVLGAGHIAGIDTAYFDPDARGIAQAAEAIRATHDLSQRGMVFGFVGRLNRDKGLDELAAAFAAYPDPDA